MTTQLWFYEMMSQEFGPVPLSEIHQLIADGMLSSSDRVRLSSGDDWIMAAELADAESGAAAAEQADELPNIDDFKFESPQTQPASPGTPARPKATPEPEPSVQEEAEPEFYIQSLGHVLGPLNQDELVELAISGSVSRGDEIREGEDGSWVAVEAIPALQTEIMRQSSVSTDAPANASTTAPPKKRPSSKPRQKSGRSGRQAGSGGPARKRKRKKPRTDDFLQEIFSEVFTTEGKLREDLQSDKPKPAASSTASLPPQVASAPATPVSPVSPASPVANPTAASVASPGHASAGFAPPPTQPSHPAFRPSPKKKSSGFDVSDPKVLGIAGGLLAVILLVTAGFMGMLPMPGSSIDSTSFFVDFTNAVPKFQGKSKDEWNKFRKEFAPTASGLIVGLKTRAQTDPEAQLQHKAARLAYELMALPYDDTDGQNELLADLKEVLASDG